MSNERQVRILSAENLRFPEEGSSSQGKSDPKLRPKGVGNGKLVKIPTPPYLTFERCSDAGGYTSLVMEYQVQASERDSLGKSGLLLIANCDGELLRKRSRRFQTAKKSC